MLTKTRLAEYGRCPKLFWWADREDLRTPATWLTRQGQEVGVRAREAFPGGLLVAGPGGAPEVLLAATREALDGPAPHLFEAAFAADGVLVRPDVLTRFDGGWVLTEVKSGSGDDEEAKPGARERKLAAHDLDIAVQLHVLEASGLDVVRCMLMRLDPDHRAGDTRSPFVTTDRTTEVRSRLPEVRALVARAREIVAHDEPPESAMGSWCKKPRDCVYLDRCKRQHGLDEPGSVTELHSARNLIWSAVARGIRRIVDLDAPLKGLHARQLAAARSGGAVVERELLIRELDALTFPLLHLDFEAVQFGLPRYPGTKSWTHVPFQFSLHVEHGPDAGVEHFEYLHDVDDDPRPALVRELSALLARWPERPILAWYKTFEEGCLKGLAAAYPEHAPILTAAASKLIDPIPIVKRTYYHPDFGGSFSLKVVAPVLLGREGSYAALEVQDGLAAVQGWRDMLACPDAAERARLRDALLAYCRQDTQVMIDIVRRLRAIAAGEEPAAP